MYVNGKLETWKERVKTSFHGQNVPFDVYCNAAAVLGICSVYKQGKNYHPQVYVEVNTSVNTPTLKNNSVTC